MESTAKIRTDISASFSFIKPNSPICLPKALRSFAYFEAVMITYLAPPRHDAPRVTPRIQNIKRNNVAAAHFVQQVFLRHLAILQKHRRGGAAMDAHLVLFIAGLAAGEILFNDESGELLAIHFRKDDEEVGKAAVGDPHLLA